MASMLQHHLHTPCMDLFKTIIIHEQEECATSTVGLPFSSAADIEPWQQAVRPNDNYGADKNQNPPQYYFKARGYTNSLPKLMYGSSAQWLSSAASKQQVHEPPPLL